LGGARAPYSVSVIDLHCHILAGIDDGPATLEESIALAREAAAAGTRTLVATPHVNRRYANDAAIIAAKVPELNARLDAEGIGLEVRPGAEIAIGRAVELDAEELQALTLGGGPWLLVEPPFTPGAAGVEILLLDLQRQGHRLLLAHPERCPAFQRDPQMLRSLVRGGVLTSITAGSLVGRFGGEVRRFTMDLVAEGLVHNVASDAHDLGERSPAIAALLAHSRLEAFADWWTQEVPSAILSGGEIPSRPRVALPQSSPPTRRWRWGRQLRAS
jgi:protein-tyrosine phosphatase